jgi:hypothetical protein
MFDSVHTQKDFHFWILVHPTRPRRRYVFASLQHGVISAATTTHRSGLERHGYPWSPPTRVPEVPIKWTRLARSPANLQVGPETLSTIPVTLEDLK